MDVGKSLQKWAGLGSRRASPDHRETSVSQPEVASYKQKLLKTIPHFKNHLNNVILYILFGRTRGSIFLGQSFMWMQLQFIPLETEQSVHEDPTIQPLRQTGCFCACVSCRAHPVSAWRNLRVFPLQTLRVP